MWQLKNWILAENIFMSATKQDGTFCKTASLNRFKHPLTALFARFPQVNTIISANPSEYLSVWATSKVVKLFNLSECWLLHWRMIMTNAHSSRFIHCRARSRSYQSCYWLLKRKLQSLVCAFTKLSIILPTLDTKVAFLLSVVSNQI